MQTVMQKQEKSTVQVNAIIPADEFNQAIERAYIRERNKFTLQGFRKGRAPRKMVERVYGADTFYDGAVDDLAPGVLEKACEEHALELVGRPSLTVEHAQEGEDLKLTFTFAVYPEVKLGEYKGLSVKRVVPEITPQQILSELEKEREARARYVEVDRPIEQGDRIVLDYKGKVGDNYFEGGTAEKGQLDIGSNQFIPGFEDSMVGISKGVWRDISVTFPDDYQAEELKGKQAVFEVCVHEIREKELPEIDDDLAKDASEFDTLDEWKADIEKKMMDQAQRQAQTAMQNEVLEQTVQNATFELPDALVDSQVDNIIRDYATRLSYQGVRLEDYMGYAGVTMDQMRADVREEAARRVSNQLVLDEITKVESIVATVEEVDGRIAELAQQYEQTLEEFQKRVTEQDRHHMEEDVAIGKTLKFLLDHADLVDEKVEKTKSTAAKAKPKATKAKPTEAKSKSASGEKAEAAAGKSKTSGKTKTTASKGKNADVKAKDTASTAKKTEVKRKSTAAKENTDENK